MYNFRRRLREERKRRGLKQEDYAKLGGVTKTSQSQYETGGRTPDATYLVKLHESGVDVAYLLTGVPSSSGLTPDEEHLLSLYRRLDEREKQMILASVTGLTHAGVQIQGDGNSTKIFQGNVAGDAVFENNSKKQK